MIRSTSVAVVAASALVVTACAPAATTSASGSSSASASTCAPSALKTLTSGTFTFATDNPAYSPWFSDNAPSNGKGFESAVAYAVAAKLGYAADKVKWTTAGFNAAIAPGAKTFDADINEFTITDARKKAVDFSKSYYSVAQAVVTIKGTPAASATTLAGLKDVKIGAQVGTTSYTSATDQIKPSEQIAVYNTNDDAKQALSNGQIGALIVDLPTAFEITGAEEIKNSVIVGQVTTSGTPDEFGMVLDKGSSLTSCVSWAIEQLYEDATLMNLKQQWLSSTGNAPELK